MFDRMGRQFEQRGMPTLESVPVDLRDAGDEYELVVDVPGYHTDDIELTFSDDTLTIDASREESSEAESADDTEVRYVRQERGHSVSRSVRFPEPVDEEDISASYTNGTLTIVAPKVDAEAGHHIDIE